MDEQVKEMVAAVRADRTVGRGTCSSIDECYEDEELGEYLRSRGAIDGASAVLIALEMEGLHLEQGLNQRWGEDDDPQLLDYNEFQEKLQSYGGEG